MNKSDQISLVHELCMRMALEISSRIIDGSIPEEWDGHELRVLVAEKASDNAARTLVRKNPRSARARLYRNTILTANIL